MQGARIRWNEAYISYAAKTEDEAQRRRWTFYEVVKKNCARFHGIQNDRGVKTTRLT
jgi:hypothetical protein